MKIHYRHLKVKSLLFSTRHINKCRSRTMPLEDVRAVDHAGTACRTCMWCRALYAQRCACGMTVYVGVQAQQRWPIIAMFILKPSPPSNYSSIICRFSPASPSPNLQLALSERHRRKRLNKGTREMVKDARCETGMKLRCCMRV